LNIGFDCRLEWLYYFCYFCDCGRYLCCDCGL